MNKEKRFDPNLDLTLMVVPPEEKFCYSPSFNVQILKIDGQFRFLRLLWPVWSWSTWLVILVQMTSSRHRLYWFTIKNWFFLQNWSPTDWSGWSWPDWSQKHQGFQPRTVPGYGFKIFDAWPRSLLQGFRSLWNRFINNSLGKK